MNKKIFWVFIIFFLVPFALYSIWTHSCKYSYLGNNRGLVKFFFGDKVVVYPEDSVVCSKMINSCYWEPMEWFVVRPLIKSADNIIEIGSNFGIYTVRMAKAITKGGGKLY